MRPIKVFFQTQKKVLIQIAFGLLFVALGLFFIRQQQSEMSSVKTAILQANQSWLGVGVLFLFLFTIIQGLMYVFSFNAINQKISFKTGIILFLKRNFISVFLPAGMLTNMAFFNHEVEKKENVTKTQIYFASSIFSFCSIVTGILTGLPGLIWLFFRSNLSDDLILGFGVSLLFLGAIGYVIFDLFNKGRLYHLLENRVPIIFQIISDFRNQNFIRIYFWRVLILSLLIEIIGIIHLYIAIKAVGGVTSLEIALIGYSIVVLILSSSPFLRGMGAIEVALTYALTLFGLETSIAISAAFVFRFYEFWGVLLLGMLSFINKKDSMLLRLTPSILIFGMGIVNIISGITPSLPIRMELLSQMLPMEAIQASQLLILLAGVMMLAVSIYLLFGLYNAWLAAVILTGISLVTHITKGIDWEEALVAALVLTALIYQKKQYFIKTDVTLAKRSIFPGLITMSTVMIFATIGFYFLNPTHFQVNFTLWESFQEAVSTFFLIRTDLTPVTSFGEEFLITINIMGTLSMGYFVFLLLRPIIYKPSTQQDADKILAEELIKKHGSSSLDYFKTYFDKQLWFSKNRDAFISYKSSGLYAISLENPTCANFAEMEIHIKAFDEYCRNNGLRTAYYRVPQSKAHIYEKLGKKLLPIGEEATVNLETWSLTGKEKAPLRNIVNKFSKQGYVFKVHHPPHQDGFLQQLRAVSDSWLRDTDRSELVFSQGIFLQSELKKQIIYSLETSEGKVEGFINQIPDGIPGECNFDLMRKTEDAPNGTMDYLFVQMFEQMKSQGFSKCDLGMVPMSGISDPNNIQERVMKLAYEKIKRLSHYKSLRNYKEKFDPDWEMMYIAYDSSIDLVYLPLALEKIVHQ